VACNSIATTVQAGGHLREGTTFALADAGRTANSHSQLLSIFW